MNKTRPIRKDLDLEAAAAHVAYEIETMLFAADHLEWGHCSPAVEPEGKGKDVFLEAFLLHYRNLRAFLCPSLQGVVTDDDVLASDFLGEETLRDLADGAVLGKEQRRINKMLAHISYSRGPYRRPDERWPVWSMRDEVMEPLVAFVHSLPAQRQAWFLTSLVLRDVFAVGSAGPPSSASYHGYFEDRHMPGLHWDDIGRRAPPAGPCHTQAERIEEEGEAPEAADRMDSEKDSGAKGA